MTILTIKTLFFFGDQVAVAYLKAMTSNSKLNYLAIVVSYLRSAVTVERMVCNMGHNRLAVYYRRLVDLDRVKVTLWPRVLVVQGRDHLQSHFDAKEIVSREIRLW